MDGHFMYVILPLLPVMVGGVLLLLIVFHLLAVQRSSPRTELARPAQTSASETLHARIVREDPPLSSTSGIAQPLRQEELSGTTKSCTKTMTVPNSVTTQELRFEERIDPTSTPSSRLAFERKPPDRFIDGTPRAMNLSGERQLPIPRKILTRLVINLDGLGDAESESFVHHQLFQTKWQNSATFKKCTEIAESFLRNRLKPHHSFFNSSSRYRILKQVTPDSSNTWLALRSRQNQPKDQPYEIELDSESVQNIGGWKWSLPRKLSDHMNKDSDVRLFLELTLSYTRFTPHPISKCGESKCTKAIRDALSQERISLPENELNHVTDAWFVSGELINKYFTKALIQHLVDRDRALAKDPGWMKLSDQDKKKFVDDVHNFCTRLLASAILARIDLRYIFYLNKAKIQDVQIPLHPEDKKHLPFLSPNNLSLDFQNFIGYQGSCKAHSFPDPDGPEHKSRSRHTKPSLRQHLILADNIVIPILEADVIQGGSNALVYKIRLHGDHHKFSPDRNRHFALKRIVRDSRLNDISHESTILAKLSAVPHPHLTPLLASWQQGDSCSILLPLAKENLYSLMTRGCPPELDGCFVRWLLKQMTGLAAALDHIHNLGPADLGPEAENTVKDGNRSKSGYHHDLHPSNILVFDNDVLKISDFGTARIQQVLGSGQNSYVSRKALCNPDYEAPENVLEQKASRPHDVWALGCIFLEMLVWVSGQSVQEFHDARLNALETKGGIVHDAAFWYDLGGKGYLKSVVKSTIADLRQRHKNKFVFQTLLTLVEHMLRIESQPDRPKSRILISAAYSTLRNMISQAELDLGEEGEDYFAKASPPKQSSTYAPPSDVMSREPSEIGDNDLGPKFLGQNRLPVPIPTNHVRRKSTGDLRKLSQFPNLSVATKTLMPSSDLRSDLAQAGGQHTGEADLPSTPGTPSIKLTYADDEQRIFTNHLVITPPQSNGSQGSSPSTPQFPLSEGEYGYISSRINPEELEELGRMV